MECIKYKINSAMNVELEDLFATALTSGIQRDELHNVSKIDKQTKAKLIEKPVDYRYISIIVCLTSFLFIVGQPMEAYTSPIQYMVDTFADRVYSSESSCLLQHSAVTIELSRPVEKCSICRGINEVPIVHNMTKEYFMKHHAYTGVPVLIKNGTGNWTALRIFGYRYFKILYAKLKAIDDFDELGCQFFPYKTNIRNLRQLFTMSKARAKMEKDQWYVGWSNCIPRVQSILRKHYQRPAFLPDDSESSSLDWVFMGGSGHGAMMHIDSVDRPSWQAMVKGKKTWFLEPPPECELECSKHLNATMEPGDILVVDTNKWFHSTYIHPGNISVTIGSEYD